MMTFDEYYATEEGVKFLMGLEMINAKKISFLVISNSMVSKYGKFKIKGILIKEIFNYLKLNYAELEENYGFYKKILEAGSTREFYKVFYGRANCIKELEDLVNKLTKKNVSELNKYDFVELCLILDEFYNQEDVSLFSNRLAFFNLCEKLVVCFDNNASDNIDATKIDPIFDEIEINNVIKNEKLLELLKSMNIYTFKDLRTFNKILLNILLMEYKEELKIITEDYYSKECACKKIKNQLANIINELNKRFSQYDIVGLLKRRFGYNLEKRDQLQKIADEYGVTRERIRQLEAKADSILKKRVEILFSINVYLSLFLGGDKLFVDKKEFEKDFNDDEIFFIRKLIENFSDKYVFDKYYEFYYYSGALEQIENYLSVDNLYYLEQECDNMSGYEKKYLYRNYNLISQNIYIKKGNKELDLICLLIDELFPNGYKAADDSSFKYLKKVFADRFGYDFQLTQRALTGDICRNKYCLVDRGTYLHENSVSSLSEELISRIMLYIEENNPMVTYNAIFDEFETQLKALGINNVYYLKGVLDPKLPDEYNTAKDYIVLGKKDITYRQNVKNYINTLNGVFSIKELEKKFPGNKQYVFLNIISTMGNVLQFENLQFMRVESLNITDKLKEDLKKEVDNLFVLQNHDCITSRKLYGRIAFINKEMMQLLGEVNNHFRLFSLLSNIFKDDYEFRRPYIGVLGKKDINKYSLVKEYINTLEYFNVKAVNSFINKHRIGGLYSFTELFEEMSGEYVLITYDTMVKKENLSIVESVLNKIEFELKYYISSFGEINTAAFKGYSAFPQVKYRWNKYLLIGIIRTFLSEKFEVEVVGSTYNDCEFRIREV